MTLNNVIKIALFLSCNIILGFFIDSIIYYICNKRVKAKVRIGDLPLFFVLGLGAYVYYEMFFSILGVKSSITHFIFLFIAFLLSYGVFCFKRRASSDKIKGQCRRKTLWPGIIIATAIAFPLLISLIMAMAFPQFDIDMAAHILMKAKIFTVDTYKTSIFMHDGLFLSMHNRYPPFAGLFFNLLLLFGCETISCYQAVNYFIFLLAGISIYHYLKNKIPLWQGLSWFFIFIFTREYISSQYIMDSTDIALSLAFLLSAVWFIEFNNTKDFYSLVICAALTGISTLIKNEALVFSLVMLLIWSWLNKKITFKYLIIVAIISLPWILYRRTLPAGINDAETLIKISYIFQNLKYLNYFLTEVFKIMLHNWNAAFILLVPSALFLSKNKYRKDIVIFLLFIIPLIFVYFIMFLLQIGRYSLIFINTGFFRVLSHIYPMAIISLALAAGQLISKPKTTLTA